MLSCKTPFIWMTYALPVDTPAGSERASQLAGQAIGLLVACKCKGGVGAVSVHNRTLLTAVLLQQIQQWVTGAQVPCPLALWVTCDSTDTGIFGAPSIGRCALQWQDCPRTVPTDSRFATSQADLDRNTAQQVTQQRAQHLLVHLGELMAIWYVSCHAAHPRAKACWPACADYGTAAPCMGGGCVQSLLPLLPVLVLSLPLGSCATQKLLLLGCQCFRHLQHCGSALWVLHWPRWKPACANLELELELRLKRLLDAR